MPLFGIVCPLCGELIARSTAEGVMSIFSFHTQGHASEVIREAESLLIG